MEVILKSNIFITLLGSLLCHFLTLQLKTQPLLPPHRR